MKRIVFVGITLLVACAPAFAASIIVGAPGNNPNSFPFGGTTTGAGTRYQQAYSAADFSALGAITITSIDFLNGSGNFATSTYSLYFSTISAGIDTLSNSNFDSNLGADNTFFTSVLLSGAAPPTLTFAGTPFFYNPANGNLLLDIIISPGGAVGPSPTANYRFRSGATGIFSRYHNFGGGNIGFGLVTQFDYTPQTVPESSSLVLSLAGIAVLAGFRNFRRSNTNVFEQGQLFLSGTKATRGLLGYRSVSRIP